MTCNIDEAVLEELKKLNKTLNTLTDEHIRHFNEWRKHNGL